jgi:hypothetical protein
MRERTIDGLHDWTFGNGKNNYKVNSDAVAQLIGTRLRSFLGDCFFDLGAGIDWFNLLGSKKLIELRLAISATILNTPDVTGIVELSTNLDNNRRMTIQYSVNTIYGKAAGVVSAGV